MKRPLNAARTALIAQSLLWAVVLSVPGCNNPGSGSGAGPAGSKGGPTVMAQHIELTASSANLIEVGYTVQFSASVINSDGTSIPLGPTSGVTWLSSDPKIANIDSNGLVTGKTTGGPVTISATYQGQSATAPVTVTGVLQSVTVAPINVSVASGLTVQLSASASYSDGAGNISTQVLTSGVNWKSSDTTVATVDATGLVEGWAVGNAVIRATFTDSTGSTTLVGSTTVTVTAAVPLTVIVAFPPPTGTSGGSITTTSSGSAYTTSGGSTSPTPVSTAAPVNISVAAGLSVTLVAYATMSDGTTVVLSSGVNWVSSDPSIATVSSAGVVTGIKPGTVTVTAFYGTSSSSVPATVTVTAAVLQSVTLVPVGPLPVGVSVQIPAGGTYSDGTSPSLPATGVSWSSSNTSVAIVDSTGTVTGIAPGTAIITATFGGQSSSTVVTVIAAAVTSVGMSADSVTIPKGLTAQLSVSGSFSNGSTQVLTSGVAWSSSDPTVATVDSTGVVTGVGTGTATITASVTGGFSVSIQVKVTLAVLQSVSISPPSAAVAAGLAVQLTANGTYSDGTTAALTSGVTWTSSNNSIATVLGTGVVSGVAQGAATITASYGGLSGTSAVNVTAPVLQSVSVSPPSASTPAGLTVQLTANGNYSGGSSAALSSGVTWTSSNTTVAIVNSSGVVTGVVPGTATITASSAGFSGASTVTVTAAVLQAVNVTPSSASVAPGLTVQLTANGSYSDGTTKALTSGVTWASSSNAIATVSSSGLVMGVAPGAATITAGYGGFSGASAVTVTAPALQSVSVSPTAATVPEGMTQQLTAYGNYSDGSSAALSSGVTWTSGNTGVATVNGSGLVTAKEDGTAVITASFAGFSGSSTVTVTDRVVQSISITPANVSVAAGLTVQLNVLAGMSDSTALTWASSVTWTSSNTGVATVSGNGLVTGVAAGTASITATVGNHSDTTTVTVTPAVPQSVSVTPSASVVAAGTSEQLAASATYSNGLVSALGWGVAWASSNTAVAIVDGRGVVTGIAAGSAAISVSVGGVTGAATVTVGPALLVSISVSPAAATVAAGSTSQLTATGYYSDGSRVAVSGATWTSDNPAVATVSGTGVVTGVGAGTATVTAGFGGTVGASIVTVPAPQQAVLRSIIILTPGGQTTLVDDATMPLQAYGTYSDGTSAALSAGIVWSSSNTNVATVDSNGHVIGVDEGTVAVTVTDKATGISQSVGLTVTENGGANPEGTRHDRKTLLF